MRDFAVLIPAYRPKWSLPQYVNDLLKNEIAHVIIIDDGNDSDYEALFQQLAEFERCTVLTHSKNQGKGAGLKTGFRYFLKHFSELSGIVTADADGQHLIQDVLNVGECLVNRKGVFVLGTRNFDRKKVPTRSFIGNTFTSRVIRLLFGMYIQDTQTGLRGIATKELPWLIKLPGDHFDYEMTMLIQLIKQKKRIIRVDIKAVYEEEHFSTFDTYGDTVRIIKHVAREVLVRT